MQKQYVAVPIGDATRHRVTLRDVPSQGSEIPGRQFLFLQDLINNGVYNGLLACGPIPFQTLSIKHDGNCWVITMEAVEGGRNR